MGFVRKILGVKPKAAAPEHVVDPERAKRMAAARSAALKMQLVGSKNQLKVDLEDDSTQTREGVVIGG
jgi:hypothetical protein